MYRVSVLVVRPAGLPREIFAHSWLDRLAPAIAERARPHAALRRLVVNVPPDVLEQAVARVFPAPFDGLMEFWFDGAEAAAETMHALSAERELRELAAGIVDGTRGVAWLAEVVPCKPESGSQIKFLAAGDVAEGLTLAEAHDYWQNTHPLVAQTAPQVWEPLTRYTQFHGRELPALEMGSWLAVPRFVPMCSDMGFARQRDFIDAYTSSQYAAIVRPDEEKFSRPGDMLSFVSTEERVLIG